MEEVFFVCDINRRLRHIRFPEALLIIYSKETLGEPYIFKRYHKDDFVQCSFVVYPQLPVYVKRSWNIQASGKFILKVLP